MISVRGLNIASELFVLFEVHYYEFLTWSA